MLMGRNGSCKSPPLRSLNVGEIVNSMPWNYRADPPQRYSSNYQRYLERGGEVRFEEDVAGFVATGKNNGDMARYYFFCLALDQLTKEELPGDLAEIGVYKGETATLIAKIARRLGKAAWLLDTFEGFDPKDLQGIDYGQPEQFDDTSLDSVHQNRIRCARHAA